MGKTSYFSTAIGKQTLAGICTLLSFLLLVMGAENEQDLLMNIGIIILFGSILSIPAMHFWNYYAAKKD